MTDTPKGGRRASITPQRRIDLLVALAIAAPAVVAISIATIGGEENPLAGPQPPTTSALTSSTVVCPAGLSGADGAVRLARVPGVAGGESHRRRADGHRRAGAQRRRTGQRGGDRRLRQGRRGARHRRRPRGAARAARVPRARVRRVVRRRRRLGPLRHHRRAW
ncbi:hypothetical protein G5V59_24285 [Nocardioides sp. W3-2-3]|uniref:hypothetical protein n=1 Tax=Nocardioides convexus TaxID=2712224 RepID=UPI0024188285|nr:hypothetical protein [Nocardioides convexus]NHA01760.1 hypothetical protein [Nocardioides convexus]